MGTLDHRYMAEESDDEQESSVIVQHKLTWRSLRKQLLFVLICWFS